MDIARRSKPITVTHTTGKIILKTSLFLFLITNAPLVFSIYTNPQRTQNLDSMEYSVHKKVCLIVTPKFKIVKFKEGYTQLEHTLLF